MSSFSQLIDEEEAEIIQEVRTTAQAQFIDLSVRYVELAERLKQTEQKAERYRLAYASASQRAAELSLTLREELD